MREQIKKHAVKKSERRFITFFASFLLLDVIAFKTASTPEGDPEGDTIKKSL